MPCRHAGHPRRPRSLSHRLAALAVMLAAFVGGAAHAQTPPAPAQAAAAGFATLAFSDAFTADTFTAAAPTRLWWNSFWFFPPPVGGAALLSGSGVVRITTPGTTPNTHLVNHPVNSDPYGPDHLFGYFEARMRFSAGSGGDVKNSWGAFWLLSKPAIENKVTGADGNKAWCEIDVAEMFGHGFLNTTIHSWVQIGSGTPKDTINPAHLNMVTADPIDGHWHTFGVLWQEGVVTWFLDDVQVATYSHAFSVCNTQPMTVVLSSQSLTGDSQVADVAWVRVWH
ncbi:glycoside hydrolase family 16 protein [Bradyrhizobium sp. 2TAF24]|uniref:glycoside hydrolase family 16 protein n=1 Tax=Bradyrhizobium sp. 2TAF24 TaxID=3233011 RepID=UPI003F8E7AD7